MAKPLLALVLAASFLTAAAPTVAHAQRLVVVNGRIVKSEGRLVGVDLAHARRAIEETVSYAEQTLGDAWTSGMHPEIPETKILENPYQYTEWDAGSAQWKH